MNAPARGIVSPSVVAVCHGIDVLAAPHLTPGMIASMAAGRYERHEIACGLAAILLDGIGDTVRISLLGDPVPEIAAAFDILQATQRRVRRPELIACPTCGRLAIDLDSLLDLAQMRGGKQPGAITGVA